MFDWLHNQTETLSVLSRAYCQNKFVGVCLSGKWYTAGSCIMFTSKESEDKCPAASISLNIQYNIYYTVLLVDGNQ